MALMLRGAVDYRPSAEPLRVEIERADLRSQLDDVSGADFRRMWQMAAPAFAAPMQASAISCGVTGSAGFCARVGKLPVTAQVKMVGFMTPPRDRSPEMARTWSTWRD
jgi:hypothetical protein